MPPTLVYDDACGFCTWWARQFDEYTDIRIVPFSEVDPALEDRLPEDYEDCAHLVTEDAVYSCGESIEQAFVRSDVGKPLKPVADLLRKSALYNSVREDVYRAVAENRPLFSELVSAEPPEE